MNDNLSDKQFRWVPDQNPRHLIINHIMTWHMKGEGENNMKSMATGGMTAEELHNIHMDYHKENKFDEGKEHKHFTPKKRK